MVFYHEKNTNLGNFKPKCPKYIFYYHDINSKFYALFVCMCGVSLRNCLSGGLPFSSVSPFPLLEVTRCTADVI